MKKTGIYWNKVENEAVEAYNHAPTLRERDRIFEDKLYQPLQKLVECVYNRYEFIYAKSNHPSEDLQAMALGHIVTNVLPKLKSDKKPNYFSYLSVSCKNYFILLNTNYYNKMKREWSMDDVGTGNEENTKQLANHMVSLPEVYTTPASEFMVKFLEELKKKKSLVCASTFAKQLTRRKRFFDCLVEVLSQNNIEEVLQIMDGLSSNSSGKRETYRLLAEKSNCKPYVFSPILQRIREKVLIPLRQVEGSWK